MHLFGLKDEPEDSPARVAAFLLADGLACLRELRDFVRAFGRGGGRRG